MHVGSIVELKINLLNNPKGTIGFVYEEYNIGDGPGFSIILPNGNHDGFSPDEQKIFLNEIGFSEQMMDYEFSNVMKLADDFENGIFDGVLGGDQWKRI